MLDVTKSLREDPAELRAFTALLLAEVKSQAVLIAKLRHQLAGQRAHRFGPSSETSEQLQLALEMSEIAIASMTAKLRLPEDVPADKPKRKPIPDHIPRVEVELTPGNTACTRCGGKLRRLGEDVTEELEYVPGRFIVNRIVRPRMACSGCDCFTQSLCRRARSNVGVPVRVCSPMCWSTNTRITCRCIAKARSSSATGSILTARHWRIGWANPPPCWHHWPMPSGDMCWRGKPSSPTTPRWECWRAVFLRGGHRQDPDRTALGLRPRRAPLGQRHPARQLVSLLVRPQRRAPEGSPHRIQRLDACRWLCRF